MSITLDSIANDRLMEDLYGKKKYVENDENIFSQFSTIGENSLTYKDEEEDSLFTENEQDSVILTQEDFSNNMMQLIKNGFSLTEALTETKQQQFEDLFQKRLAENGGDPIEAAKYARARMSSEPTDEEYQRFVSDMATEYAEIDTDISNPLNDYAKALQDELDAKNKKIGYNLYEEMQKADKIDVTKKPSFDDSLNIDFDLQKLMFKNNFANEIDDNPLTNPERFSRNIIV